MSPSLPQDLEPAVITAKLKAFQESLQLPSNFAKELSTALKMLTEKQEQTYAEIIGYVNTHQKETTETLDKGVSKLEDNLSRINENSQENLTRLQRTATPEILQRHRQLSFNAPSSQ